MSPDLRRAHEPELAVGAQEQDVRDGFRIDRPFAVDRLQSPTASSTQADPALEVELHHEVREPPEDLRAEPGVVAGLLERLLAERDRLGDAPVVVADDRPQAERVGARRARRAPRSIAASRIRSASRYSDRSMNRHSAASRARSSAATGSSAGVSRLASW